MNDDFFNGIIDQLGSKGLLRSGGEKIKYDLQEPPYFPNKESLKIMLDNIRIHLQKKFPGQLVLGECFNPQANFFYIARVTPLWRPIIKKQRGKRREFLFFLFDEPSIILEWVTEKKHIFYWISDESLQDIAQEEIQNYLLTSLGSWTMEKYQINKF